MWLSDLKDNEKAQIVRIIGSSAFKKRITEMGFIKGQQIQVIKNAPMKDPIEYNIMGYDVSLRRKEASLIEVNVLTDEISCALPNTNFTTDTFSVRKLQVQSSKKISVALVGNPNCGKTTFFNFATNSQEHVGNYSGVTVDAKKSVVQYKGVELEITDLPGTYSLTTFTPEEKYVRDFLIHQKPDVVVNVVDASNLERNLYLTTQLIEMGVNVILVLNMYDELLARGDVFKHADLAAMTGMMMVPAISKKGKGIHETFDAVIQSLEDSKINRRKMYIKYGSSIEKAIEDIDHNVVAPNLFLFPENLSLRFIAIKLLEGDADFLAMLRQNEIHQSFSSHLSKVRHNLETELGDDIQTLFTDVRYGFISGALKETFKPAPPSRRKTSMLIDDFLTNKYLGFPIFLFIMWLMFQGTFTLGDFPMTWIDSGVLWISEMLRIYMPDGMLKDLFIDGIIGGVGGVIVFLPNIVLLFFFISLLEDSGYMARAAFITDKLMHKIGLHGKSFIPLVMGFGCNVPAIMGTRTLENRSERFITILIIPFMSCSARLPVYLLIISAFFSQHQGTLLFGIYLIGILLAVISGFLLKKTVFRAKETPFVMELPPYRIPTLKSTVRHMWHKASEYLKKMGGIILVASVLVWALGYFPRNNEKLVEYDDQIASIQQQLNDKPSDDQLIILQESLKEAELSREAKRQEMSYIGVLGKTIEPVMQPLGFDWKMSISLLTGVVAKEIVVSTMGVLYQVEVEDGTINLEEKLKSEVYTTGERKGQPVFTSQSAFSFLLFTLIYFPCVAVVAAIKREAEHWKWSLFTVGYTTVLAYIVSLVYYQVSQLFI